MSKMEAVKVFAKNYFPLAGAIVVVYGIIYGAIVWFMTPEE